MYTKYKSCRLIFLMLDNQSFHTTLVNLLLEEINNGTQGVYETTITRVSNNKDDIQEVIRSVIIKRKPDIILPIGQLCSIALKEVLNSMVNGPAAIFVGIREPLAYALIQSPPTHNTHKTSIVRLSSPPLAIAHYFSIFYPVIRSVFIPYSANDDYLINQAIEAKRYLTSIGMNVFLAPITGDTQMTIEVVRSYLPKVQGVIFLEGCLSNMVQSRVARLCWEYEIVFCGSGQFAINSGAACALGGDLAPIAHEAYKKICAYWGNNKPTTIMPVTILPNNEEFEVNVDILLRLGITPENVLTLCSSSNIKIVRRWVSPPRK